jgi:hypothetical protein
MGYIVGAKMAELCGSWQWGLRATPVMGIVAVVLILLLLQDPPRGESEGHQHLKAQTYGVSIGTCGSAIIPGSSIFNNKPLPGTKSKNVRYPCSLTSLDKEKRLKKQNEHF